MAGKDNLIPNSARSSEEVRKNSAKGGVNSGKSRRERKTIQKILNEFLDDDIKNNPHFEKLAKKMGLEREKNIKYMFTVVCLLNSVKSGNLGDLERLSKLLGEDKQNENADVLSKLDKVIGEVDKLAE